MPSSICSYRFSTGTSIRNRRKYPFPWCSYRCNADAFHDTRHQARCTSAKMQPFRCLSFEVSMWFSLSELRPIAQLLRTLRDHAYCERAGWYIVTVQLFNWMVYRISSGSWKIRMTRDQWRHMDIGARGLRTKRRAARQVQLQRGTSWTERTERFKSSEARLACCCCAASVGCCSKSVQHDVRLSIFLARAYVCY